MDQERRTAFRMPAQSEGAAILRWGRKNVVARVVEESANGMGLLVPVGSPVEKGQKLAVATGEGCCEAQVMHVTSTGDELRVGLRRVRELDMLPSNSMLGVTPLVQRSAAFAVSLVFAVALYIACVSFFSGGALAARLFGEGELSHADHRDQMARRYLDLDSLSSVKVAQMLDLSLEQETRIQSIVSDTSAGLSVLFETRDQYEPSVWSDMGMSLIRVSYMEVQSVLTDEQKARWDAMLEESSSSSNAE